MRYYDDVVDLAERLGERERGDRCGAHEPFRAEDDRRGIRLVDISRDFGADLVDPGRDAEVRHAVRLSEAERGDP